MEQAQRDAACGGCAGGAQAAPRVGATRELAADRPLLLPYAADRTVPSPMHEGMARGRRRARGAPQQVAGCDAHAPAHARANAGQPGTEGTGGRQRSDRSNAKPAASASAHIRRPSALSRRQRLQPCLSLAAEHTHSKPPAALGRLSLAKGLCAASSVRLRFGAPPVLWYNKALPLPRLQALPAALQRCLQPAALPVPPLRCLHLCSAACALKALPAAPQRCLRPHSAACASLT